MRGHDRQQLCNGPISFPTEVTSSGTWSLVLLPAVLTGTIFLLQECGELK